MAAITAEERRLISRRGRWERKTKRRTVDAVMVLTAHRILAPLDVTRPARCRVISAHGTLDLDIVPSAAGVVLHYTVDGETIPAYLVRWAVTTPHYGGTRYWWVCPQCGKVRARLYAGRRFLCRRCQGLAYPSTQTRSKLPVIEARMRALLRRLGADGPITDDPPARPDTMRKSTYTRLAYEYRRLARLRDVTPTADLLGRMTPVYHGWAREMWADIKATRGIQDPEAQPAHTAATPVPVGRHPARFTLGDLARVAGVTYAFAQEAQRERLLRADAGRTSRRWRYRGKLAAWLRKLADLRAAGLTWSELRDWVARRFTPGHEAERQYPAGYVRNQVDTEGIPGQKV